MIFESLLWHKWKFDWKLLFIQDNFKDSDCWLFVDNAYVFDDPKDPWDYPTSLSIEQMDVDMLSSDFVAVKLGDVNGSVSNIDNTSTDDPLIYGDFSTDSLSVNGNLTVAGDRLEFENNAFCTNYLLSIRQKKYFWR